ncbi:MAG: hypothetical protein KAR87_03860 [Candidatus Aenigmarchaeota archaeon]|nr:hypothetical protein [Candidatus Aenigmarchaeota archaeon]
MYNDTYSTNKQNGGNISRHKTQSEQKQKDIDELTNILKEAIKSDGCCFCNNSHPCQTLETAILCKYKKSYVHIECCSSKCSWHGEPCKHAINIHM